MWPCFKIIILSAMLAFELSCGHSESLRIPDESAFSFAVEKYIESKNMDLAIARYKTFQLDGSGLQADAVIAMKYAGQGPKVTSRFAFKFQKTDRVWRVTSHTQLQ